MKRFLPSVLMASLALLVSLASAQTTAPKKKAPVKKSTSATTTKKAPAKSTSSKKAPPKKGAPKRPAVTWRNRQLSPTPDRYREIQSALAAKGYLKPEDASGSWSQGSADALKQFQQDQKIAPSGKINSLSLIALGLGPKRESPTIPPPPPKPPQ